MTPASPFADPLTVFPPEIVLRILDFSPVSALASLTAASKAWHEFIDVTHQQAIYTSESKTRQPPGCSRDLSFLADARTFSRLFEETASWKDLCKRQTLLSRNWTDRQPMSQESVLQIGNDPVWRFRPDFKRRFFVSSSHAGGLNVTDMDTGRVLWRLPSTLDSNGDAVRPYAHLEYQDGMVVFDREGDAVEVWQADQGDAPRGEFRRIAVLNHRCQTRGFQLSYWTLCVVSNQGQGFVYDMTQRPPKLTTHLKIEKDAVGHLDQSEDVVIYSIGPAGYYAYDKASGDFLGVLQPSHCTDQYHILPPAASSPSATAALAGAARYGAAHRPFPPGAPRKDSLVPIDIVKGPLPSSEHMWEGPNEWGAGMLDGDLFVGFSRAGRVFVCSDWRKALRDQASLAANSSLIECKSDGSSFDLGGWLSVQNHRLMFEIQDRIYVVALDDSNRVQDTASHPPASYSLLTSSAPQLAVPTLGWRQSLPNLPGGVQHNDNPARIFPTKAIRVVSLAPDLPGVTSKSNSDTPSSTTADGLFDPESQDRPPADEIWRSQAGLLQLLSMLGDEFGEEEDDDELQAVVTGLGDGDAEWEDVDDDEDESGSDDEPDGQDPSPAHPSEHS
ncbi:hypothetical protein N7532_000932 [Penicillium argentinense]|uniref:F-box domain-containing protein n=1 Tax=Penicillium argentinense TaxID=1131581 RepID=A0A9W9G1L5_9EURO|nr:uncharacterized protein N7532_000932 [Penicillium argentinense]KAJ5110397.1 hypothetical protein N7532_000932 [Penicillium argentinense]